MSLGYGWSATMPYSKIKIATNGLILSTITCDLETGWMTIANESTRREYRALLSLYAPLRSSPNLYERYAYEVILERLIGIFPEHIFKKKMKKNARRKLPALINDPYLKLKDPLLIWGYRDEWSILITLSGTNVPEKTFGPFSSVDEGSKIEQIIDLVSEGERLFFDGL